MAKYVCKGCKNCYNENMLIGIFTPYLDTMSGGERYMLTIASLLSESNDVVIFWDPKDEEKYKKIAKNKLGINIDSVKFTSNIFSPKFSAINRIQESRKYNKVIVLSDGSIPLVSTDLILHFQFPLEWVKPSLFTKLKTKFVKKIICNSNFTKKYIDKTFAVNSSVLYPPVNLITPGKKENKIINVGRLNKLDDGTYFKRQDLLISAFKKIVDQGLKDWSLVIVFSTKDQKDESQLQSFKDLLKNYPIRILHNPSNSELRKEYESSKIYWHAAGYEQDLTTHPEWAEHFGITTVEAMSAGVVPVVFNAGGQKEIVDNDSDGFLWNTLEELIGRTDSLIKDENKRKEMAEKSREKAKEFTEEKFKEKLLKLIS